MSSFRYEKEKEKDPIVDAIEKLIKASSGDNEKLIMALSSALSSMSVDNTVNVPETKVIVSTDIERVIKAMPQPREMMVTVDNSKIAEIIDRPRDSYKFDIERDNQGRLKTIMARPFSETSK